MTPGLREQLLAATPTPDRTRLVLDLSRVTLLDASALSMLVATARTYAEVELRGACRLTCRTLEVAGLTDLVTIR